MEQSQHVSEVSQTGSVQLAAIVQHVDVSAVVTCQTGIQVVAEHVVSGGPPQVDGLSGVADNSSQAQLSLHSVDSFESSLVALGGNHGGGINASLLQDVSVVDQADSFHSVGEADGAEISVDVLSVGVSSPSLVSHVDQSTGLAPLLSFSIGTEDEDVGHVASLEVTLDGTVDVDTAAQGLDDDFNTGLGLVDLSQLLQLSVDLDLAVDHTDGICGGSSGQWLLV